MAERAVLQVLTGVLWRRDWPLAVTNSHCFIAKQVLNMTNKTLSTLLVLTALIAFLGYFLMPAGPRFAEVPQFVRTGYMFFFGALPVLLLMKLISKIFPQGFQHETVSLNETMFGIFFVFLTKEAREEWRGYIREQKKREAA
ncbi:MAG: hypothetical protein L6Q60_04410 [Rhodocyclaceae bacterium]|nr:hypothetical protein [Rhodocyclaceae bacterium]